MTRNISSSLAMFMLGLLLIWSLTWVIRRIWGSCGTKIIHNYNKALTWPVVAIVSFVLILISYVHESIKIGSFAISGGICLAYLARFIVILLVIFLYDLMSRRIGASGLGRFVGVAMGAEIGRTLFTV